MRLELYQALMERALAVNDVKTAQAAFRTIFRIINARNAMRGL